jgi:hydroxymethylbilane synthase
MKLILGTRGSELALVQAKEVANSISLHHKNINIEIKVIKSNGCKWQETKEACTQDKKKWTGLLEESLLEKEVDFIVHSAKDLPVEIDPETTCHSILRRANPFDAFIGKSRDGERLRFSSLSENSSIGTASLRRKTQLLDYNQKLEIVPHRGNVPTRIGKLRKSDSLSGIILAVAGIERLKIKNLDYQVISKDIILPAMNQGTLAVQFLNSNLEIKETIKAVIDQRTQDCFEIERYIVGKLDANCSSAISVFAEYLSVGEQIEVSVCIIGVTSRIKINERVLTDIENWQRDCDVLYNALIKQNANDLLNES